MEASKKKSSPRGRKDGEEYQGRFIDLTLDRWFKRTFTRKDILLLTLQLILPEKNIKSVTLVRNEHTNRIPGGRNVIIDVECMSQSGERFIVEMQREPQYWFRERTLYYSAVAIQQQLRSGRDDDPDVQETGWNDDAIAQEAGTSVTRGGGYDFLPVYVLSLLNFSLHKEDKGRRVKYVYSIRENESGELMTDRLTYIFVELPNHREPDDPAATRLDRFCYLMRNMSKLKQRPEQDEQDALFSLLLDSADFTTFTPDEKNRYQDDMTTERDIENQMFYKYNEGRKEGKAEGIAEGLAEGTANANLEVARKMLSMGYPVGDIAKITTLTAEQIEALK